MLLTERKAIKMKPVKVALVGNKHDHAELNFNAMKAHPEAFEIVGVSELDHTRNCKSYEDYTVYSVDELLAMDDLEAVVIEAGKEYEVGYALKFAEKGIPVFLDKPGSSDIPRFEKFMSIMKEKNLPVGMGYMYRFNPCVMKAKELVAKGELGEIYSVEAQMSSRHPTDKRVWLGRYVGGPMFYLGCHLVDMVCQFMGFPKEILPMSTSTGNDGLSETDFGFAVFKYDNGVSFMKTCSSECNGFDRRQLVICGTKGTIEIKPWEILEPEGKQSTEMSYTIASSPKVFNWSGAAEHERTEPYHRYYPMLEHFAKMVRGEAQMTMSYEYEVELLKTVVHACGAEVDTFKGER